MSLFKKEVPNDSFDGGYCFIALCPALRQDIGLFDLMSSAAHMSSVAT